MDAGTAFAKCSVRCFCKTVCKLPVFLGQVERRMCSCQLNSDPWTSHCRASGCSPKQFGFGRDVSIPRELAELASDLILSMIQENKTLSCDSPLPRWLDEATKHTEEAS